MNTKNKYTTRLLLTALFIVGFGFGWMTLLHSRPDETRSRIVSSLSHSAKQQPSSPSSHSSSASSPAPSKASNSDPQHSELTAVSQSRPDSVATIAHKEIIDAEGHHYPLRTYTTLSTPNDPGASQWWTSSTDLGTLWGMSPGSYTPTIAMIDTGFGLNHEEFANRWLLNSGEQGVATSENPSKLNCTDRGLTLNESCNLIDDDHDGIVDDESGPTTIQNPSQLNCTAQGKALDKSCDLIDDDGNGYVDDVRGWDFAYGDNNVQAGQVDPSGPGTMHGTMTTGVAAATGNNGVGIAGVNWQAKILPIEAMDDEATGDTLTVANAVVYAADRHADVINLSLGSSADDPYLRQAIDYAISKGSLVVAAAGNSGCDCISYPANYPEVVAVGSESPSGTLSSFSSYGANLDLLAPGENISTTGWSTAYPTNGYVSGAAGTSFASPFVSGLLAALKSHQPTATNGELIAAVKETADHQTLTASNPHSSLLGFGVAHAGRSISRVTTAATPTIRYDLGPASTADSLGSSRVYACLDGTFPSTQLFELGNGSGYEYTTSDLEVATAQANGQSVRSLGYQCIGQPQDRPATLRVIDLDREIH